MATAPANIRALTGKLIQSVTGLTHQNDPENHKLCLDFALKTFKTQNFGRTDQFDIIEKLDGLEEKFRIYNHESLADALEVRLDELPSKTAKYMPEILSLFLTLSDQPLKNSSLADLDLLVKPEVEKGLTWEDIIADDPLVGDIWNDVDFGAESSDAWTEDESDSRLFGEDIIQENKKKTKRKREKFEEEEEDTPAGIEGFMLNSDKEGLERMQKAQYWSNRVEVIAEEVDVSLGSGVVDNLWIVSEVQALREVLFMLSGFPCVLFRVGDGAKDTSTVCVDTDTLNRQFGLRHASLKTFVALLEWYAEKGTKLNRIREFVQTKEDLPERQAFLAAVEKKLAVFDRFSADFQEKFVGNGEDQPVSLLSLQSSLGLLLRPFDTLSTIITSLTTTSNPSTLASQHLELLFNSATQYQSIGDKPSFRFIATTFFASLQTYLRPIREWMESGTLRSSDERFLISKNRSDDEVELGSLWHDQYSLCTDSDGNLRAPRFVHNSAARIFMTGKSVVFLKRLIDYDVPSISQLPTVTELTFRSVCGNDKSSLAPFSELFAASFEAWTNNCHHSVSSRLRDVLYHNCGLWKSLDAIEYVFLCKNGHLLDMLAQTVFEKLDRGVEMWSDRFLLTELVQGVFSGVAAVEAWRLRMRAEKKGLRVKEGRRGVEMLGGIQIEYALPWPVMNVIQKSAFEVYRRIFTFLLQIRRSRYVLERLGYLKEDFRTVGEPAEGMLYYSLKYKLLWFANILYSYLTDLVLLPQTENMRANLAKAVDMDGMVDVHRKYINKIRDQCLLGPKLAPIQQSIISLLDLAIVFSDAHMAHANRLLYEAADHSIRDMSILISTPRRRRRRRRKPGHSEDDDTESDDLEDEIGNDEDDEDDSRASFEQGEYSERLAAMVEKFEQGLGFVKAGFRGVARAGVMPHLDLLAEELEGVGGAARGGPW